jgi:hypothetical protein
MQSNNRFDALNNNSNVSSNFNAIKNNSFQTSHNNLVTNRFVSKHTNEERKKKQKENEFIKSLDNLTEFPDLQTKINAKNKTKTCNTIKFIDIMNNNSNSNNNNNNHFNEIETLDTVPDGCVCIKNDEVTKKQVCVYGKNAGPIISKKKIDTEEPHIVFQRLVNLHQSRKYEHIRKWGIDEYDKMFMFQNYDYEYFDKLDQQNKYDMEKYYQNIHNLNNNNYIDSYNDIEIDN